MTECKNKMANLLVLQINTFIFINFEFFYNKNFNSQNKN